MLFQSINFNQSEALKAGGNGSAFFEGNTEQMVKITRAEFVQSQKTGTIGLEFDVINKNEQKGHFTLWYQKADGSYIEGSFRTLQSIMGVVSVQTLTPVNMLISKYDFNRKEVVQVDCINAKELIGQIFVGLFIKNFEIYNNKKRQKTELYVAFNQNRQTYREMNAKMPAQDIEYLTQRMLEKSAKNEKDVDAKLKQTTYILQSYDTNTFSQQEAVNAIYQKNVAEQQILQQSPIEKDIPF